MGKENELYDPLNTKTIGGELRLDVETYENIQDNIHIEGVNKKLLELTDLVGRVTNNRSSSGPIPGTAQIFTATVTSSGTAVIPFTPNPGEVWAFQGICANVDFASAGSIKYQFYLDDLRNSNEVYFFYMVSSDTNVIFFADNDSRFWAAGPIYFTDKMVLKVEATDSTGTMNDVTFQVAAIRVR